MAESIRSQIEKFRKLIAQIQKEIEKERAKAKSGDITASDEKRIAEYERQVAALKADVDRLQKQFEADRDEWNGFVVQGDLAELQQQIETLKAWEVIDFASVTSGLGTAIAQSQDENYREAINRLAEAKTSMVKPYAEYEKQYAAKGRYENLRWNLDDRFKAAETSAFCTPTARGGIATLAAAFSIATKHADAKDYVSAEDTLGPVESEMALVEKEIDRTETEDRAVRAELEPLQATAGNARPCEFEELQTRTDQAVSQVNKIPELIDAFDFNSARNEIATLTHEFQRIAVEADSLRAAKKAEEEKKAREKAEWDRQASRFHDFQNKVSEMEGWNMPVAALRQGVSDIESLVAGEEFLPAIDRLTEGEGAIKAPWAEYQTQLEAQKTYKAARPGLDQRAAAARQNKFCDGIVATGLSELASDLDFMQGKDEARDYVEANTRIAPATAKLDKIERDLRDLEMQAQIAEEMGGASPEEAAREAKRRLYVAEQPIAQGRVDAVAKADVLARMDAGRLEQMQSELASGETDYGAEKYAEALDRVRMVIDSMPPLEEQVRKQTELKARFKAMLTETQDKAGVHARSAYNTIREQAAVVENDLAAGEKLAAAHDYAGAIDLAKVWENDLDKIVLAEAAIMRDHSEADAALAAIMPRLNRALIDTPPELETACVTVRSHSDEVERLYDVEDYKAARTAIATLTEMLVELEKQVEKLTQKKLYESAVETLRLAERLSHLAPLQYPEAETECVAVQDLDNERISLAAAESYEEARRKAFDTGTALNAFDHKWDAIVAARSQFEASEANLRKDAKEALSPYDPSSDELVAAQAELSGHMDTLDRAVAESRFIAASKIAEDARRSIEAVVKIKFELTPIDENATDDYITGIVKLVAASFSSGAATAVVNFRVDVLDRVNSERSGQTFSKWSGFTLDIVSAIASVCPGAGPVVAAVASGVKTAIAISADIADSMEDDADRRAAQQLIAGLEKQAEEVYDAFNFGFAATLKTTSRSHYDKIGRCLATKDPSGARAAVTSAGVPADTSPMQAGAAFLAQLRSAMAAKRG